MGIRSETFNVLQVGIGFLLILFAFNSQGFIEQTVIYGKHSEGVVSKHAGYISPAIIYATFTCTNLLAASIIGVLGPKISMVIGACFYALFECGFLFLNEPFLYISSALVGVAASMMWTAQGKYLAMNSTEETAGLHSGLFWGVSQICITGGGTFLYFAFRNLKEGDTIDDSTIKLVYGIFAIITIVGVVILALLRIPNQRVHTETEPKSENNVEITFSQRINSTFSLLRTKRMLFLIFTSVYVGIDLSFWSGIYPSAISFTSKLATNTKIIMAFNAIAQGLGQTTGGFLFGILKETTKKLGRSRIILIGISFHLLVYTGIYLNFPSNSPLGKTEDEGIISPPSPVIAVVCGYFLGFGNACWHTQIISLLISRYNENSAEAFSLFKLFQGLATATSFLYATKLRMEFHILILVLTGILGFTGFYMADRAPTTEKEKADHVNQ
ncbi:hypothetical protein FO519_008612 [Halicephalobus sp. NKZ332]|nr:hypothetical protein FO519_008612 [Halicephalobus sp. NKZ332]